jgi:GATA-binding protein
MSAVMTSPLLTMNPTSTEHDFRFPRRPAGRDADRPPNAGGNAHDNDHDRHDEWRDSLRELRADVDGTYVAASKALRNPAHFPFLQVAAADRDPSLDQLQQHDPLAIQVWKFFHQTKQQLPDQQRMENLTWRMMAIGMRRRSREQEQKYEFSGPFLFLFFFSLLRLALSAASSYKWTAFCVWVCFRVTRACMF